MIREDVRDRELTVYHRVGGNFKTKEFWWWGGIFWTILYVSVCCVCVFEMKGVSCEGFPHDRTQPMHLVWKKAKGREGGF